MGFQTEWLCAAENNVTLNYDALCISKLEKKSERIVKCQSQIYVPESLKQICFVNQILPLICIWRFRLDTQEE